MTYNMIMVDYDYGQIKTIAARKAKEAGLTDAQATLLTSIPNFNQIIADAVSVDRPTDRELAEKKILTMEKGEQYLAAFLIAEHHEKQHKKNT